MSNKNTRVNVNLSLIEVALISALLYQKATEPGLDPRIIERMNSVADALHKGLDEAGVE